MRQPSPGTEPLPLPRPVRRQRQMRQPNPINPNVPRMPPAVASESMLPPISPISSSDGASLSSISESSGSTRSSSLRHSNNKDHTSLLGATPDSPTKRIRNVSLEKPTSPAEEMKQHEQGTSTDGNIEDDEDEKNQNSNSNNNDHTTNEIPSGASSMESSSDDIIPLADGYSPKQKFRKKRVLKGGAYVFEDASSSASFSVSDHYSESGSSNLFPSTQNAANISRRTTSTQSILDTIPQEVEASNRSEDPDDYGGTSGIDGNGDTDNNNQNRQYFPLASDDDDDDGNRNRNRNRSNKNDDEGNRDKNEKAMVVHVVETVNDDDNDIDDDIDEADESATDEQFEDEFINHSSTEEVSLERHRNSENETTEDDTLVGTDNEASAADAMHLDSPHSPELLASPRSEEHFLDEDSGGTDSANEERKTNLSATWSSDTDEHSLPSHPMSDEGAFPSMDDRQAVISWRERMGPGVILNTVSEEERSGGSLV
mmetsp:Transcript_9323/g.26636  ORF Transcript_9323/g.26636 Transcript_9323/m.26636 type:complete len:485 (+) Transcript_9323:3-1457(+)